MASLSDTAVALAQGLIRCRSVTPEEGGALFQIEQVLKPAGFSAERLRFDETGTPSIDNLFAWLGDHGPHLCFAGHSDVVPPGDESSWAHAPFGGDIADGLLYGRGAADMKGAIAAFAAAAVDYAAEKGGKLPGTISLLITGDEEGPAINGTVKVLPWMAEHGHKPDHAVVGEPTCAHRLGETIKIGRRGSLNGRLTVHGVQGHVAYPALANNPVKGLIKVLAAYYAEPLDQGSAHFAPSNLEVTSIDVGNPASNLIPAKAEARFNVRFNDNHTPEALHAWLRERAMSALRETGLQASFDFAPANPVFVTDPGPLDALLAEAISDVTGLTPELSTSGGTSDARFIKDYCPVVEFGLVNETVHQVDEHVLVTDLEQLALIYRRFIALYFDAFTTAKDEILA